MSGIEAQRDELQACGEDGVRRGRAMDLIRSRAALGRLHTARQRHELAGEAYRGACTVLDRVKASLKDPALSAALDRSMAVRETYALAAERA
jgi:hypothetical protein